MQTPRVLVIQALRFVVPKTPLQLAAKIDTESATETPSDSSETTTLPATKRRRPPKRKVIKNPVHITFPLKGLDMTSYLRTPSSGEEEEIYDLFGVVEHVGRRMDGGHYIAYVRAKDSFGKDIWWKCNDAKCWMVTSDMVSAVQGYIWFYERRTKRGTAPEEWGDVLNEQADMGLATPESVDRPVEGSTEDRAVVQSEESDIKTSIPEKEGGSESNSWQGRLRVSSLEGAGKYKV